jgi:hypothetical protein
MTTITRVTLTCDLCGDAENVKTWTFELDGQAYEIDLCRKDGRALGRVAAGYIAKARKMIARPGHRQAQRQRGGKPRVRGATAATGDGARAPGSEVSGRGRVSGSLPEKAETKSSDQKGLYVYGILPADIEVAADMPGVGEHPGLLRVVRFEGLAALISEVDLSARLGSPDDLSIYREILDATAVEVPVLPLRFGTVLPSEHALAEELLAARHDEFSAALDRLEGRAEFQVKGRYVKDAVLDEVLLQNKRAAKLRDATHGKDPDAARKARIELGQLINKAVRARREQDTRALRQAMDRVCAASLAREPAHELDAVHVAFLVAVNDEPEVERVSEALACKWEGRIDVQLLGPMAAYDFAGTAHAGLTRAGTSIGHVG